MSYTRGEQVPRPAEVEYLFRSAGDALQRTEAQLRSLAQYFQGVDMKVANELEIAVSNVIQARSYTRTSERAGLNKVMPHRMNAGELD